MIEVEYLPAFESGPFEGGANKWHFETFDEFAKWVHGYVCKACLHDFEEFNGRPAVTLEDWLSMGCGAEIYITDSNDMINWNFIMEKKNGSSKGS